MFEQVIAPDKAAQEVDKWLDIKKIFPKDREKNAEFVNIMADAVQYGAIEIDEKGVITQKLNFPIEDIDGKTVLSELTYNPRVDTGTLQSKTQNIKVAMGVYTAYASALTGQNVSILNKLDSSDFKILQAITVFFT